MCAETGEPGQARRYAKAMKAPLIFSSASHSINVHKVRRLPLCACQYVFLPSWDMSFLFRDVGEHKSAASKCIPSDGWWVASMSCPGVGKRVRRRCC